jgi:hypothetical protein
VTTAVDQQVRFLLSVQQTATTDTKKISATSTYFEVRAWTLDM